MTRNKENKKLEKRGSRRSSAAQGGRRGAPPAFGQSWRCWEWRRRERTRRHKNPKPGEAAQPMLEKDAILSGDMGKPGVHYIYP